MNSTKWPMCRFARENMQNCIYLKILHNIMLISINYFIRKNPDAKIVRWNEFKKIREIWWCIWRALKKNLHLLYTLVFVFDGTLIAEKVCKLGVILKQRDCTYFFILHLVPMKPPSFVLFLQYLWRMVYYTLDSTICFM